MYQTMARPGANPSVEPSEMKYPQYRIEKERIFRGSPFVDDYKLGQVLPCMRRLSPSDPLNATLAELASKVARSVYLVIQELGKFPIIHFCMSLPYLASEKPTPEGLRSPEEMVKVYRGIENMLFEMYEELGEGQSITGDLVLQKAAKILGVKKIALPMNQVLGIHNCLM
jgi:hypothetical protein